MRHKSNSVIANANAKKKNKFSDKYATLSRCNLLETCRLDSKRTTLQKMWQTNKIKFMNIEELFRLAFLCTFAWR